MQTDSILVWLWLRPWVLAFIQGSERSVLIMSIIIVNSCQSLKTARGWEGGWEVALPHPRASALTSTLVEEAVA